jgi:MFS family permease
MDFANRTINFLTLHSGLHRFSINIFDVFSAVYLIGLGLPFPVVALASAGCCILRSILRPLSLVLIEKIGLRKTLIIGVLINSLLFLVLSKVNGINLWLYFYIFYMALCDISYWLPYHSYYASAGDQERRGKQVGMQHGFITLFTMLAPLIGGLMIVNFGFLALYISATFIMLLSAIPLFFTKDVSLGEPMSFKEALKMVDKRGFTLKIGEGILYMHTFVWTIVLFYLVGNYVTLGGLVTFQLVLTSALFIFLGYLIDKGDGKQIMKIGLLTIGIVIMLRAFFVTTIPYIIATNAIIAFGMTFHSSSFEVGFYNLAKQSKNTLWFNFWGELGWDIGATVALLISAGLFVLGVPLRFTIVFSLIGLYIIYFVLKKFYSVKELKVTVNEG